MDKCLLATPLKSLHCSGLVGMGKDQGHSQNCPPPHQPPSFSRSEEPSLTQQQHGTHRLIYSTVQFSLSHSSTFAASRTSWTCIIESRVEIHTHEGQNRARLQFSGGVHNQTKELNTCCLMFSSS
jgi:hypothetical protein